MILIFKVLPSIIDQLKMEGTNRLVSEFIGRMVYCNDDDHEICTMPLCWFNPEMAIKKSGSHGIDCYFIYSSHLGPAWNFPDEVMAVI